MYISLITEFTVHVVSSISPDIAHVGVYFMPLFHIHIHLFGLSVSPPFLSGHFFLSNVASYPSFFFVDYDFGDIFPMLQSMPNADWEGGTWLFPTAIMSSFLPVPTSKSHNISHAHFPMDWLRMHVCVAFYCPSL